MTRASAAWRKSPGEGALRVRSAVGAVLASGARRTSMSSSEFVRRAVRALAVACALLVSVGAQAASAGIVVDDDKAQCPKAGFPTISRALAFAPPGATISVCPG